jgi:hypothetical protein
MRFMMLMIPQGYEQAKPGTLPDASGSRSQRTASPSRCPLSTGRWRVIATKDPGRTEKDDTRYVPIWALRPCGVRGLRADTRAAAEGQAAERVAGSAGPDRTDGAPIAMGTVRVEMGHKSLYMLTRVRPD